MATEKDGSNQGLAKRHNVVVRTLNTAFADPSATRPQRYGAIGATAAGAGAVLGGTIVGIDELVVHGSGLFVAAADAIGTAFTVPTVDAAVPAAAVFGLATAIGRYWEADHTSRGRLTGNTSAEATREGHELVASFLVRAGVVVAGAAGVTAGAMLLAPGLGGSHMDGAAHVAGNVAEVFGGIAASAAAYSGYWKHRIHEAAAPPRAALSE